MGNWLDDAIGFFSPKRGYYREDWRQGLEKIRNYDAGDYSRSNTNWRATNDSAEYTDRMDRDTVRARARDLERNSDIANSVIGAFKHNVIGGGYNLQARTENEKLNSEIEELWKNWCKKRNCDVTETQSFNQMMRMAVERKKVDGGMLFHKVYVKDSKIPFKLQCIEVDELDSSWLIPKKAGNKVIGGIELNEYNKAEGYWIRRYNLDGISISDPVFINEKDMIFYFSKTRPSQIREMSSMSQTVTRIRDTNEFMEAVSLKERILACLSVFIRKISPGEAGAGRPQYNDTNKYNYNGKTIVPGMIRYLNPGEDAFTVNPAGQATDATNYTKQQLRLIASGQGISYEAVSRDMSESNYSSARQGMIEDDLTYQEDRELIVEIMDEIYETFVISAILSGSISIRGFWENKSKYLKHEWIQAPKRWIDPLKESNANKIAIETGQKTFKQIAAENGRDWREQLDDMAEVAEYIRQKNIQIGGTTSEDSRKARTVN